MISKRSYGYSVARNAARKAVHLLATCKCEGKFTTVIMTDTHWTGWLMLRSEDGRHFGLYKPRKGSLREKEESLQLAKVCVEDALRRENLLGQPEGK